MLELIESSISKFLSFRFVKSLKNSVIFILMDQGHFSRHIKKIVKKRKRAWERGWSHISMKLSIKTSKGGLPDLNFN